MSDRRKPRPVTAVTAFSKHVNPETLALLIPPSLEEPLKCLFSWGQKALPGMGEQVIAQLSFGKVFQSPAELSISLFRAKDMNPLFQVGKPRWTSLRVVSKRERH